jgi:mannose/fructose/N-acetylgalactosamine-specific phosphotransferase system component IID
MLKQICNAPKWSSNASGLLTILPLSLTPFTYLDEAESYTQLNKMIPPKRLRQYVSQLTAGINMLQVHPAFFNTLPDEVKFCINVFTAVMKHRVSAQLDG